MIFLYKIHLEISNLNYLINTYIEYINLLSMSSSELEKRIKCESRELFLYNKNSND